MSISIDAGGLLSKSQITTNKVSKKAVSIGSSFTNKNYGKSLGVGTASQLEKTRNNKKKKLSPEIIARKIAQGKNVSREERNYLKENFLILYRKAMSANRLRENLEEALKSAKSDTAKAAAVAQASTEARVFAAAGTGSEGGEDSSVGAGLFSDAIQAALKKYGSKELNKEMQEFHGFYKDDSLEEDYLQEDKKLKI